MVIVNGIQGLAPISIKANLGERIILDASKSYDPDGDKLTFNWWIQKDISANPDIKLEPQGSKVAITMPQNMQMGNTHIVCEVIMTSPL